MHLTNMSLPSLRNLPYFTWWDWLKYKDPSEDWGLADFALKDVYIDCDVKELITSYEYWFSNYSWKPKSFYEIHLIGSNTANFPEHFELPLKLSWLTRVFFTEGFKYPMGLYWFPREPYQRWVIHPGGGRQKVIKMFSSENDLIEFLTFNTDGVKVPFKKVLTDKNEFEKYTNEVLQADYMVNWVAEKGTIIPHCLFESSNNNEHCIDSCERILKILHKYTISINDETRIFSTGNIPMNIKTDGSDESKLRAYMLLPFFDSYDKSILEKYQIEYIT